MVKILLDFFLRWK